MFVIYIYIYIYIEGLGPLVASSLRSDAAAQTLGLLNHVVFIDSPSNYVNLSGKQVNNWWLGSHR